MIYYERYERRRFLLSMAPKVGSLWRPKHSPVDRIIVKGIFHDNEYTTSDILCGYFATNEMHDFVIGIDMFNYNFSPIEI